MTPKYKHLIFSIILDLLGMATYVFPLLGEYGDMIYGPIYAILIYWMYRRKGLPAKLAAIVGLVEEVLPGTDFIPTATIMWLYSYVWQKN